MNLIFEKRSVCGRVSYYPISESAIILLSAFKHGRGNRKVLTQKMVDTLISSGIDLVII